MLVEAHQARDDSGAGEVERLRAGRNGDADRGADGGDFAVVDDDGLILDGCGARAVDDTDVREGDDRRADGDEGLRAGSETVLGRGGHGEDGGREDEAVGVGFHRVQLYGELVIGWCGEVGKQGPGPEARVVGFSGTKLRKRKWRGWLRVAGHGPSWLEKF